MDWGFLLSTMLSSSGVVTQPHGIYMPSQGVMSGKKASSNPGFCPIKGQLSVPCSQARARNQFSSLSPSTTRTMPPCQILAINPALNLVIDVMTIGPHGRLRSYLFRIEPPHATLSVISFPHKPECSGTQHIPTVCQVGISFNAFWHCSTKGDVVLAAWSVFRATWPSEQIIIPLAYP